MLLCVFVPVFIWGGSLISDRQQLRQDLVRLHVVASSDAPEAQNLKLQVRDAIVSSLEEAMADIRDPEAAKAYLRENLQKLQTIANQVLSDAGCTDQAVVTLQEEEFDTRHYDTFSLPAGIYDSLRIIIGPGDGHNWWCVVFPTLCVPVSAEGFESVAAGAGFSEELSAALEGKDGYEFRFYLLDLLGRLENILREG